MTTDVTERKITPAFRDIDETRDIVSLEAAKTFGKTDVGLGMRYEHDNNNDSQNLWRGGGGVPPAVPPPGTQRFITEKSTDDVDLFSGHATTVTRFSDSFWLTTAYSYTSLIDDIGGSRIYGTTYNAAYNNPVPTLGSRDHGYLNLAGTTQVKQWVINLNTMWVPLKGLTVLSAFRFTWENSQSDTVYLDTTLREIPPIPHASNSFQDINTFAQSLEMRYTGHQLGSFMPGASGRSSTATSTRAKLQSTFPRSPGLRTLACFGKSTRPASIGIHWIGSTYPRSTFTRACTMITRRPSRANNW